MLCLPNISPTFITNVIFVLIIWGKKYFKYISSEFRSEINKNTVHENESYNLCESYNLRDA